MYQDWATELPKEFVEEAMKSIVSDYLEVIDQYIRTMYKREALQCEELLWERPRDLGEEQEAKMAKSWPEIPLFDEESGISLRTDLVINEDGEPVILDLKTTSIENDRWYSGYMDRLPDSAHELQVRIYRYLFNKHNYYKKKVRKVGLGYINLLVKHGMERQEHEVYKDMGEDEDLEVKELISHLSLQRSNWIKEGKTLPCTYGKCGKHNGNK